MIIKGAEKIFGVKAFQNILTKDWRDPGTSGGRIIRKLDV